VNLAPIGSNLVVFHKAEGKYPNQVYCFYYIRQRYTDSSLYSSSYLLDIPKPIRDLTTASRRSILMHRVIEVKGEGGRFGSVRRNCIVDYRSADDGKPLIASWDETKVLEFR
jgi:hypothetical protein